jgi:hypothetical protein
MTGSSPLTHGQLLDEARRVDVSDDAIALASVAGGDGLARLVAAIGAGRAVVVRSRFPREEEAGRISAPAPRETARFDFSGLLHSIAGEEPALQR